MFQGEYWWIDGTLVGADGQVGDMDHSAYAIQHATNAILDALNIEGNGESILLSDYADELAALDLDIKDENGLVAALKEAGVDEPHNLILYAQDRLDAREYGLEQLGWIRIRENNVDVAGVTESSLREIYSAYREVDSEMPEQEFDEEAINIWDLNTKKFYRGVLLGDIKNGDVSHLLGLGESRKKETAMPWTPKEASRFTKKANTPERKRKWASVANSVLRQSGDDAKAVRIANAKCCESKVEQAIDMLLAGALMVLLCLVPQGVKADYIDGKPVGSATSSSSVATNPPPGPGYVLSTDGTNNIWVKASDTNALSLAGGTVTGRVNISGSFSGAIPDSVYTGPLFSFNESAATNATQFRCSGMFLGRDTGADSVERNMRVITGFRINYPPYVNQAISLCASYEDNTGISHALAGLATYDPVLDRYYAGFFQGEVDVAGPFVVTGDTTLNGNLTVTGVTTNILVTNIYETAYSTTMIASNAVVTNLLTIDGPATMRMTNNTAVLDGLYVANLTGPDIAGIKADDLALKAATNAHQIQIVALQGATDFLSSVAAELQTSTNALQGRVTALQAATGNLMSADAILRAATNALQSQTDSLKLSTNAMTIRLAAVESDGTSLKAATNALNSRMGTAESSITALKGATGSYATVQGVSAATNGLATTSYVAHVVSGIPMTPSNWSNYKMLSNVDGNGKSVTNLATISVSTVTNVTSITLNGDRRTAWPSPGVAAMYRYTVFSGPIGNVMVFASGTNVSATFVGASMTPGNGGLVSLTIPTGVKVVSAMIYYDSSALGSFPAYNVIGVDVGTGDMANAAHATRWCPTYKTFSAVDGTHDTADFGGSLDMSILSRFYITGLSQDKTFIKLDF